MLHKSTEKLIKQLQSRKGRKKNGLFVAEGVKTVNAILEQNCFVLKQLIMVSEMEPIFQRMNASIVDVQEFATISQQEKPEGVLGIFEMGSFPECDMARGQHLVLDRIQDPGNMGTLIRLAYWFGLDGVHVTRGCVDVYNHKVIQSSMGAIGAVPICLLDNLSEIQNKNTVFVAHMNGESIGRSKGYPNDFILVMGNEANGIDRAFLERSSIRCLSIPSHAKKGSSVDSLNVAMSAGILLQELKRQ